MDFIQSINDETKTSKTNTLEILLFSLGENNETGQNEVFGINVLKIKEVMNIPEITRPPDMPDGVEGIISLRGSIVPIINLQKFCDIKTYDDPNVLMVTRYNKNTYGFLINSIKSIERLDLSDVTIPPPILANRFGGLVTGLAELEDRKIVMIMDAEKITENATAPCDQKQTT